MLDYKPGDIIRGVSCCGEVLQAERYKGSEAARQWLEEVYWEFSRRHSPSGPDTQHHWKFAIQRSTGELIIEKEN